ncbi:hypothetical protein GCM10023205_22310 [Yinghuangia aomiensis]|uniref:Uncharacterized protein n=1 Tax=Yinghuangia aomiensis TaxID=676205 RepID=A0ABP9H3D7_9ACTN
MPVVRITRRGRPTPRRRDRSAARPSAWSREPLYGRDGATPGGGLPGLVAAVLRRPRGNAGPAAREPWPGPADTLTDAQRGGRTCVACDTPHPTLRPIGRLASGTPVFACRPCRTAALRAGSADRTP